MWLDNYYKLEWVRDVVLHRYVTATSTASYWYPADMSSNPIRGVNGTFRDYVTIGGNSFRWLATPANVISPQVNTGWTNSNYSPKLVVGSGTTPVDPSDYKLEAEITTLSAVAVTKEYDPKKGTITYSKTMKNTSDQTVTVSEIGLVGQYSYATSLSGTSYTAFAVLGYREVLETPIVVEAGETFTVEITHKVSVPGLSS